MQRSTRRLHTGAAIVEVALTLPILVLISLATLDTCKVLLVRQSAKVAAFECARVGIIPGVELAQVKGLCQSILASRGISNFSFALSVADLKQLRKGDLLKVTVSVPANTNSLSTSWFYRGKVFDESVVILVEQ